MLCSKTNGRWSQFLIFAAICTLMLLSDTVFAIADSMTLTIVPFKEGRRFVVAEVAIPAARVNPPFAVKGADGKSVPCQWETGPAGSIVRFVVPEIAANAAPTFTLETAASNPAEAMTIKEEKPGVLSINSPSRMITQYHTGSDLKEHIKPYLYPLMSHGVSMTRGYPMDKHEGEATDHPHHTGVYFAYGEVNKKDYWSKVPIEHKKFIARSGGPVYAHIVAENNWGPDLAEVQDIRTYDAGEDVVMDWEMTLTAANGPVELTKTKEGGFGLRVTTALTSVDPGKTRDKQKDRGEGQMVDALGNKGEPAIREHAASWADNFGVVNGKPVGVAIMNHPTSWRYPTNWHVRAYGLFCANPWMVQGDQHMNKGDSFTLKFRLYVHGGDPTAGKVAEVYNGYAQAKVEAK